jgi:hypothetical protein
LALAEQSSEEVDPAQLVLWTPWVGDVEEVLAVGERFIATLSGMRVTAASAP